MTRRCFSQPSLADALVKSKAGRGGFLEDLSKTFDWGAVATLFAQINAKALGAPGYPPLAMFRKVLLQQWCCLSDPAAEEAVRDRLSFRRFCGIPLDCETPDHSSIRRFRQTIGKSKLTSSLPAEVDRQLDAKKLVVKQGAMVDAAIIAAAVKRPPYDEGQVNLRDPDASFTIKNKKTCFGYKAHLAVDEGSELVRQAEMSAADPTKARAFAGVCTTARWAKS